MATSLLQISRLAFVLSIIFTHSTQAAPPLPELPKPPALEEDDLPPLPPLPVPAAQKIESSEGQNPSSSSKKNNDSTNNVQVLPPLPALPDVAPNKKIIATPDPKADDSSLSKTSVPSTPVPVPNIALPTISTPNSSSIPAPVPAPAPVSIKDQNNSKKTNYKADLTTEVEKDLSLPKEAITLVPPAQPKADIISKPEATKPQTGPVIEPKAEIKIETKPKTISAPSVPARLEPKPNIAEPSEAEIVETLKLYQKGSTQDENLLWDIDDFVLGLFSTPLKPIEKITLEQQRKQSKQQSDIAQKLRQRDALNYKIQSIPKELFESESSENRHLSSPVSVDQLQEMVINAVAKGSLMELKIAHRYGANLALLDPMTGDSLLHRAASYKQHAIVAYLLRHGLNSNGRNKAQGTAAHIAAFANDIKTMELLLAAGALTNILDMHNKTPIDYALSQQNDEIFNLLWDRLLDTERRQLLIDSTRFSNQPMVGRILDRGLSIETKNPQGHSLLIIAIEQGHQQLIAYLLQRGASLKSVNKAGISAEEQIRKIADPYLLSLLPPVMVNDPVNQQAIQSSISLPPPPRAIISKPLSVGK
jgi:hypothetical protein